MPTRTKKQKLEDDAIRASRLRETMATNGWAVVMGIIQDQYDSLMSQLLTKENPEARGGINAITEIMDDISQDLKFGEQAQKKYREKYFTN